MDLLCPKCSEPWDIDSLHEEAKQRREYPEEQTKSYSDTFGQVREEFYANGCAALGESHGDGEPNARVALIYDLMGSDIDGAASECESLS